MCWLKVLSYVVFIAQISHYGKFTALYKLVSIALQLTNQIKEKFPAKSCDARVTFLNSSGDVVVASNVSQLSERISLWEASSNF